MPANKKNTQNFNPVIHERARLLILTYLVSHYKTEISFNELKEKLDLTSGNLSVQLKKLIQIEYIIMKKIFKNNKPFTTVIITSKGREAFTRYIADMEQILKSVRK